MKIAFIASYPPRECGIATFTQNLMKSIAVNQPAADPAEAFSVIAMNDPNLQYDYPAEVSCIVRQDHQEDYLRAAEQVNRSGAQICVLQHEFGIYGGDSGVYVLSLVHRLKIPFVVTFHTVLKDPTYLQKAIVQEIVRLARGVVVMSRKAVAFLDNIYEAPPEKIHLIEHGVPDPVPEDFRSSDDLLARFAGKRVLFTFGLMNRNKGIETVIKAMPRIVASHPEAVYLVLGNTHPGVKRASGEEYRQYLETLIDRAAMREHVFLIDRFVSEADLSYYLKKIDIYVTPYLNEAQITSGTLSYAVGAGAAVLSTPYWHAQELLGEGRGVLFGFKDSARFAAVVTELLQDPSRLGELRQRAFDYGQRVRWPRTGKKYLHLFTRILEADVLETTPKETAALTVEELPPFDLSHLMRLTDQTGILQHAKYGIPNFREGYCIDDNARALMLSLMVYQRYKSPEVLKLLTVYMSFIHYMQRPDGQFRNFLAYNLNFLDEIGSEDAFGRTVWSLGMLIRHAPNSACREMGIEIFHAAVPHFRGLTYLRGIANTVVGVCNYLFSFPTDEPMLELLSELSEKLLGAYRDQRTEDWKWFEPTMLYDNAILPLALLSAHEVTGDPALKETGLESLGFLAEICFPDGWFSPVGNRGWYPKGGEVPRFDQQAIETMATVLAADQAFKISGAGLWQQRMHQCYRWFLGANDLHIPLFDHQTGGCCDGLEASGVNRNQGAESTLAYWISHMAVLRNLDAGEGPWLLSPSAHTRVVI